MFGQTITGCIVYNSLNEALEAECKNTCDVVRTRPVWVIGGKQLIEEAISHEWCDEIVFTKVHGDFDCDSKVGVNVLDLPGWYTLTERQFKANVNGQEVNICFHRVLKK